MPFSGASQWHCSGCAAANGSERQSCFACGQARRTDGAQSTETEPRRDAAPDQEPLAAQRPDKRNASRRRFLLAGLTAGAALALGAGASLFGPRLFPAAPWEREFDLDNSVSTVAWSPDGHLFAAGGGNHIKVWRTSDGQELTRLSGPDSNAGTGSIAWSPQSRSVAGTWGSGVRIWKVPSDENTSLWPYERDLMILQGQNPALYSRPMVIAWSPDGTRLAVGDSSGGLQVVNPYNGQVLRVLQAPPSNPGIPVSPVSSLAWSADGTSIVAIDVAAGCRYAIWHTTTGKAMLLPSPNWIPIHPGWVINFPALGWSPDGTTIAADNRGIIHVWQWNEQGRGWEHARSISNPSGSSALTWSPDSQRFATADSNNTIIRIWRASTGQQLGSYSANPPQNYTLTRYDFTEFFALAWAPDGKHLLSGDAEGRVLLWVVR